MTVSDGISVTEKQTDEDPQRFPDAPERNPTYQELGLCVDDNCPTAAPHSKHEENAAVVTYSPDEVADMVAGWREEQARLAEQPEATFEDQSDSQGLKVEPPSAAMEAAMYWQGRAYFTEAFLEQEFGVAFVNTLRNRRRPAVPRMGAGRDDDVTLPVRVSRGLMKNGTGKDGVPTFEMACACDLDDAMPYMRDYARLVDQEYIQVTFSRMDPTMVQRSYIEGGDRALRVDTVPPTPPSCFRCGASSLDQVIAPVSTGGDALGCIDTSACDERQRAATAAFEASLNLAPDDEERAESEEQSERDDQSLRQELQEDQGEPLNGTFKVPDGTVEAAAARHGIPLANHADGEDWSADGPPPTVSDEIAEKMAATTGRPARTARTRGTASHDHQDAEPTAVAR